MSNITAMQNKYQEALKQQQFIDPEMVEAAFEFWLSDNGHIRSPFPSYTINDLKPMAVNKIIAWSSQLSADAKKEINDEILAEKFEELLFESGITLVKTEDERLTLLYPFMPRVGDRISKQDGNEKPESIILKRAITNKGDDKYLKVVLETLETKEQWETEFQLPA